MYILSKGTVLGVYESLDWFIAKSSMEKGKLCPIFSNVDNTNKNSVPHSSELVAFINLTPADDE